ncbi:hypothetical protein V8F20_010704 [Naviculisporaceae sp. PSN 640]
MGGQLLFVNKTPSSSLLTRSKRAEKAKILSHVQSNRRKQEARKAGRNTLIDLGSSTDRTETSDDGPGSKTQSRISFSSSTSISSYYPTHNSSDPFHCTVASTDAGNHVLLHCTLYSVWRGMFLGEAFAPADVIATLQSKPEGQRADKRHAPFFTQRLRRCVEDPALMYATLAYGSSCLAWTTGQIPGSNEGTPLPPAEYFLGKALREVRMRLANTYQQHEHQLDPWLILAIYSLAVTEQWNGMPELWRRFPQKFAVVVKTGKFGRGASRVHMRALLRLVSLTGGWDRLPDTGDGLRDYLLDSAVLADKYLSMYEFTEPLVPLDWARNVGGSPTGTTFNIGIDNGQEAGLLTGIGSGSGFLDVPDTVLSAEVKSLLADIVSYCRISHLAWKEYSERGMDSAMETWLFRRLQELICRLMVLCYRAGGVDQCVCLAAHIFLLGCTANVGAQTAAKYQALRLRVLMMDHMSDLDKKKGLESPMHKGLKLWCLSTAALLSGTFPARGWFIDRMKEVWREKIEQPGVEGDALTEDAISEALGPYLFLPERQRDGIKYVIGEE